MLKRVGVYLAWTLLVAAAGSTAGDYLLFFYKQRHGRALSSVTVHQYLATPLKNGRDELDYLGESDQPCVLTLLPHGGAAPCWWLRRHKDRWVQS